MQEHKIVHEANVKAAMQCFFHEMIEGIQINVGEELAGQIADGQAAPALKRQEQIIAGEIPVGFCLRIAAVNDFVNQPQGFTVGDHPANFALENLVVDAGEVLAQVAFQNVLRLPHELLQTPNGGMSAFAHAIGVTVKNEATLKQWVDDVDQHVMNNTITKGRDADHAFLGLVDEEGFIITGFVGVRSKLVQELQSIALEIAKEGKYVRAKALASGGFPRGEQKIFKGADLAIELFVGLHRV